MAKFKAIVRYQRPDGYYGVYIRVAHNKNGEFGGYFYILGVHVTTYEHSGATRWCRFVCRRGSGGRACGRRMARDR